MAWMVYDYPEPHSAEQREPICPVCRVATTARAKEIEQTREVVFQNE